MFVLSNASSSNKTKKYHLKNKIFLFFKRLIKNIKCKYFSLYFFKKNYMYIFFIVCFIFGIVIGSLFERSSNDILSKNLSYLFFTNYTSRLNQKPAITFITSTAAYFLPILLDIIFGLSFVGAVFIPSIIFLKGFAFGISISYICKTYLFKGLLFNLSVVLPGTLFFLAALFLVSKESMNFSTSLICAQIKSTCLPRVKTYFHKISKAFIFIITASVIDSLLFHYFSNIFIF